jgi:hypothetical protein
MQNASSIIDKENLGDFQACFNNFLKSGNSPKRRQKTYHCQILQLCICNRIFKKPYIQQNTNKLLSKPIGPHKKLDMDIVNNLH